MMHRNLITNSFAIAKHDKSSIFRKMFTQFFLSIILAVSFQSTVFGDITQADLDKLGTQLIETTYGKLTIIEIGKHPKRNEILDAMTEAQFNDYLNWKSSKVEAAQQRIAEKDKNIAEINARIAEKDKNIAEINARIAEKDKNIAEINARIAEKKKGLIEKYTLYTANAEKTGKFSKKVFNWIVTNEASPDALKQRARALVADKNMQWED